MQNNLKPKSETDTAVVAELLEHKEVQDYLNSFAGYKIEDALSGILNNNNIKKLEELQTNINKQELISINDITK